MAPPAGRIKLDRKALREPDEFQTLTRQVGKWAEANRTTVVAVVAAALALAAVAAGVNWYRASQSASAAVRFQAAYDDFQASRWAEAADAFAGLARDYPRTPYGRLASL